jgi:hypothetical protein
MRLSLFPYLFLICALAWVLCSSWHPNIVSYTVSGQVVAAYGEVSAAVIRYTQQPDHHDYDEMLVLDVRADGRFQGVINVEAGSPVYFYAQKPGYTTVRTIAALKSKEEPNDIGEIQITSLHEKLDIGQLNGKRPLPILGLYKDECLRRLDDEVAVTNIRFFQDLKPVRPSCEQLALELVMMKAKVNLAGQKDLHDAYFFLEKIGQAAYISSFRPGEEQHQELLEPAPPTKRPVQLGSLSPKH